MKFSIIVPVYNTEKYLRRCLNSLIRQTYKNLEIILVDDGSTDNSGTICDEYGRMDGRVKVYHIANAGVSNARNFGLSKITGDYVMFVDSDDWIHLDTISCGYHLIKQKSADMIIFNLNKCYIHQTEEVKLLDCGYKEFYGRKILYLKELLLIPEKLTGNSNVCLAGPCCKLFSKEIVKDCYFPIKIGFGEDWCFMTQVLEKVQKAIYINEQLYYYRIRNNSLSHGFNSKVLIKKNTEFVNWITNYYENREKEDKNHIQDGVLNEFCYKNYTEAVTEIMRDDNVKIREKQAYINWYLRNINFNYNFETIDYRCVNKNLQLMRFLVYKDYRVLLWLVLRMIK